MARPQPAFKIIALAFIFALIAGCSDVSGSISSTPTPWYFLGGGDFTHGTIIDFARTWVPANREVARWQFDLARSSGADDEAYVTSPSDLENPFGTRRGHVDAWRTVRSLRLARGLTAG